MILYFQLIAVISLFCLGLRAITDDGMIGFPLREYFLDNHPGIGKPIILCTTCMSSLWGTAIFWPNVLSLQAFSPSMIPTWIAVCVSASFVNSLLWAYYESINFCESE